MTGTVLMAAVALAAQGATPLGRPVHSNPERPAVNYVVTVDSQDLTTLRVTMRIANAPGTIRLAMAHHAEYDDRFWRWLRDLTVETRGRTVPVTREDSAVWRAVPGGSEVTVRYRFALPASGSGPRRSWRPFLTATGGLLGSAQTYLYLVGHEDVPARVALDIPPGWQIATGLEPTADSHVFYAPSVDVLVDCPILLGTLRWWQFSVDGVSHRVAYWAAPGVTPFDTAAFTGGIERLVHGAVAMFGRPPYREYTFLLQDDAGDALEHGNSLTMGVRSAELARDPNAYASMIAHEFFHTWNLVRIHPAELGGVTFRAPRPTTALWWSEGVTLYYAGVLLQRAGLRDSTAARRGLVDAISNYFQNPGNARISPEQASWRSGSPQDTSNRYTASYYSQGTLLGQLLDLLIRDSTKQQRGLDDVMRALVERTGKGQGFTSSDLESTADAACGCNLQGFFADHIRGVRPLDLNRYLQILGWRSVVHWEPAADSAGHARADLRMFGLVPEDGDRVRLIVSNPETAWGRAGLRTGNELVQINGSPITTVAAFNAALRSLRIGEDVVVEYLADGAVRYATVRVTGYDLPRVELEDLPSVSSRQRLARERWAGGDF